MAQARQFATYIDVDGSTKRYIDMPEQMTNHIDMIGHTVIGLVAGASWPFKERAFIAALTTMNRHEIEKAAKFMDELRGSFAYYDEIEARRKRRQSN